MQFVLCTHHVDACPDGESSWRAQHGCAKGSKGSSKGKGKASAGHESEIVSRLSTLCISMDRRIQALEDRSSYVCIIKGENLKKEVLTLRAAWKEDENARREGHEADKTNPLEESCLRWRLPLGGCESSLRTSTERGRGTDESGGISFLASLDIASLDAAIFRARPRHPEPKEDWAWVWAFLHNATLFFAPQRPRRSGCKTASRFEGRNKAQGAGVDDVDEDMGTDNTKRPRRRWQPRLVSRGCLLLVDTSAAWSGTHGTKWVQRNDACSSMYCSLCGEEVNCRDQSYAQFVASVIGNAATRTSFLHVEPAFE